MVKVIDMQEYKSKKSGNSNNRTNSTATEQLAETAQRLFREYENITDSECIERTQSIMNRILSETK